MSSFKLSLVAPCGLYCGICTIYRAYHDGNPALFNETPKNFLKALGLPSNPSLGDVKCEGCRSSTLFSYCISCDIRKCVMEKKLTWCYECGEFPCNKLIDFQLKWQLPIIDNLRTIKDIGISEWMKKVAEKFRCSSCGTILHWFSYGICPKCK
jgi:hypothetical protein